jgi:hypothetical protein
MAVQKIPQTTALGIAKAFVVDGKTKITTFSYSSVKPDASDADVYAVGYNFGSTLMAGTLEMIERTDMGKLINA